MADARKRAAAGASGVNTDVSQIGKDKPKRQKKSEQRDNELKVLRPVRLEFAIQRDGNEVRFAVPSEFTLGDIVNRSVLDDLDQFWRMVQVEINDVIPDGINSSEFYSSPKYVDYLAIALSSSMVRKMARRIAVRVSRVLDDGLITGGRVSLEEVEQLSTSDTLALSLWFVRRYSDLVNSSKNSMRATRL